MYTTIRYLSVYAAYLLSTALFIGYFEHSINPLSWQTPYLFAYATMAIFVLVFFIKAIIRTSRNENIGKPWDK